jgi:type IV pilus assembly protein PilQ
MKCFTIFLLIAAMVKSCEAAVVQGRSEPLFDVEYLPPMPSDLLKRERAHEQEQQLDSIRKLMTNGKKLQKKTKKSTIKKGTKRLAIVQMLEQKAALEQEVFDLLKKQYENEQLQEATLSLCVKKMSIKDVIKLISSQTKIPFVVDGDVSGNLVDFSVQNLPLSAALHSILGSNLPKLALIKDLGVWRVMRHETAKEHFAGLAARERARDVEAGIYTLTNVQWTLALKQRIEKLWQGLIQASPEKHYFYMVIDEANNKVLFKTRKLFAQEFTNYLRELDVKAPEVRIDVRVVSADKNFEESFGFNWSGVYNRRASVKRNDFVGIGPVQTTDKNGSDKDTAYNNIVGWAFNLVPETASKLIKMPFVFGNKDMNTKRLTLELDAAENRSEIKTILKPSLLVHNEETAEILVGREMPLSVRLDENIAGNATNVTTVRYKDIGTKVKVTPAVSPNHEEIFLDIFVENSQLSLLDSEHQINSGNSGPAFNHTINTSRSQNRVLLRSGQTTMIGGLITNETVYEKTGVPFLQDIPVVNIFFSWKHKKIQARQLLIFITPTLEMA